MSAALPLAVTMGDPAGVGPLITMHAYARKASPRPFYVIGSPDAFRPAVSGSELVDGRGGWVLCKTIGDPAEAADVFSKALPILPIDCPAAKPGQPDVAAAPAIIESIRIAVEHVLAGKAAAVVTNPISKELLYKAGFKHPGHTEFLAELAAQGGQTRGDQTRGDQTRGGQTLDGKSPHPVMMLVGGGLKVALATIHLPLASVPAALNTGLIETTARIVDGALKRDFGLTTPRIGLCGLNPHAGENGVIGREEAEMINPAAVRLRAEGLDISNARPGDTIFHEALAGRFDAVIAMYHDQGLIPVKTLDIFGGVNVTLGLPFIRTSPDHGTAYDAAAAGAAKPESLIAALNLADQMALARAKAVQ